MSNAGRGLLTGAVLSCGRARASRSGKFAVLLADKEH
jgi:hypothetical protein